MMNKIIVGLIAAILIAACIYSALFGIGYIAEPLLIRHPGWNGNDHFYLNMGYFGAGLLTVMTAFLIFLLLACCGSYLFKLGEWVSCQYSRIFRGVS